MSDQTSIEWTDATWSPIRVRRKTDGKVGQHCERVSPGCTHCYAARHNGRNLPNGGTGLDYVRGSRDLVEAFVDERVLEQPLRWRTPKRIFVQNQTDLFGEWITDEQRDRVFAVMALAPWHTFTVLTKRPDQMREYILGLDRDEDENDGERLWTHLRPYMDRWPDPHVWMVREMRGGLPFDVPPSNVWLGVTAEDQQRADERIPILLDTQAAVRFVSVEPLLGKVDLSWLRVHEGNVDALRGKRTDDFASSGVPDGRTPRIDWVIVGGESGPGARPCDVMWIRSIVGQCRSASVPCFVKQLGRTVVDRNDAGFDGSGPREWPDGTSTNVSASYQGAPLRVFLRDKKGGDPSEWPIDLRVREFPSEGAETRRRKAGA